MWRRRSLRERFHVRRSRRIERALSVWAHLRWVLHGKGHQGVHGDNPGGDAGAKVLAEEGAEGHVLPLLDVAGCRGRKVTSLVAV
jgi:hypothetical protein